MEAVNESPLNFVFALFFAISYIQYDNYLQSIVLISTNLPRLYRILFIVIIRLCIYYADRCCISLDNWNVFQQHNWHNYAWFFVCTMVTKTRPWRHIYHDIEIPRSKNHDIEIPRPKTYDIEKRRQISHVIVIPRRFFRGQKAATSRFPD